MQMPDISQYYYDDKNSCFKLRNRFIPYIRTLLTLLVLVIPLVYVNPVAKATYKDDVSEETTLYLTSYWKYFDYVKSVSKLKEEDIDVLVKSVFKYSKKHGYKRNLILAIIKAESSFDKYAISRAGALGLMQVLMQYHSGKMKEILKEEGDFNPFDVEASIRMGTKALHEFGGDLQKYNGESRNTVYTEKVLSAKRTIDKALPET